MSRTFLLFIMSFAVTSCIGKYQSDAQVATVSDVISTSPNKLAGDTLKIDLSRSTIHWKGTKMRGAGKHEGLIDLSGGYFVLQNGEIDRGHFVADMSTIRVTDIPEHEPIPRRNLNNHLKSDDFFDVERFPEATFQISRVNKMTSDSIQVDGILTMKNNSRNINFMAESTDQTFSARFSVDRFLWNIAYEGNWADRTFVDKDIELTIELIAE